jgi:hypothetical protein
MDKHQLNEIKRMVKIGIKSQYVYIIFNLYKFLKTIVLKGVLYL